ncbi:hypothetical protein L7F22_064270 [Adiantum nelumboides]|nr:hypothetical protein [Adiantum nelumboides]
MLSSTRSTKLSSSLISSTSAGSEHTLVLEEVEYYTIVEDALMCSDADYSWPPGQYDEPSELSRVSKLAAYCSYDVAHVETLQSDCLNIVDRFSKFCMLIPCKVIATAQYIACLFTKHWYPLCGLTKFIVSDRDIKFTSNFWKALFETFGTKLNLSSAFHSQSDGQTEIYNQLAFNVLKSYVHDQQNHWKHYLLLVQAILNDSFFNAVGRTAYKAAFGLSFQSPVTVTVGLAIKKLQHVKENLQDHMDMLKLTRQNNRQAQDRYKKYVDEKRRQVVFKEGDYVFLRDSESLKTGPTPKLSPRFCGPFKILKRVGSMAYKLELPSNSRIDPVFHVSRLRQRLLREDNIIDQGVLIDFIEPPNESWIHVTYVRVIMFGIRYWSNGRIVLKKGQLGKTFPLLRRDFLLLFSRTNTLLQGGSNVRTRVLTGDT